MCTNVFICPRARVTSPAGSREYPGLPPGRSNVPAGIDVPAAYCFVNKLGHFHSILAEGVNFGLAKGFAVLFDTELLFNTII